jgi:hypothetical protein
MVHISSTIMLLLVKPTRSFTSKSPLVTCCTRIAILSSQENSLQKLFCTITAAEIDFLAVLAPKKAVNGSVPSSQLGSLLRH